MCQKTKNQNQVENNNFTDVLENYKEICYNIENARAKYRKSDENVEFMAVTKTVPAEKVNFAISKGITLLGENRVQEYLSKKDLYDKSARVDFIGHLQTNKVKYIIDSVSLIQSVDSVKLAKEISRLALKNGKVMDTLIEVNVGGEESKSGVCLDNLEELVLECAELEGINLKGFMAIPPKGCGEEIFDKMNNIFLGYKEKKIPGVSMEILSMGMSGDYEMAIKHGSTLVRIGTALFGARKYTEV